MDVISGPHQTRISSETGVSVDTLQAQKSAAGLGYGDLEMAKASGQSFNDIVAKFKAGEGWGKIAHDMGAQPRQDRERRPQIAFWARESRGHQAKHNSGARHSRKFDLVHRDHSHPERDGGPRCESSSERDDQSAGLDYL